MGNPAAGGIVANPNNNLEQLKQRLRPGGGRIGPPQEAAPPNRGDMNPGLVTGIVKGMQPPPGRMQFPGLNERMKKLMAKRGQIQPSQAPQQMPQPGMNERASAQPVLPNQQTRQRMNPSEVPTRRFERY